MEINAQDLRLKNFWEFYDAWFKELATDCSHREAYNRVELRYSAIFGENKYKSFESFYETRRQKIIRDGRR